MGIKVRKLDDSFGIWDSHNCEFINSTYFGITEQEIREYIKQHPYQKKKLMTALFIQMKT